jgi:hypothetical protein
MDSKTLINASWRCWQDDARKNPYLLSAVAFNGDDVRGNQDLGFSHEDRVEHVRQMGWLRKRVRAIPPLRTLSVRRPTMAFGKALVI